MARLMNDVRYNMENGMSASKHPKIAGVLQITTRLIRNIVILGSIVCLAGAGISEDGTFVKELQEKAAKGDANAQFNLAIMYTNGEGVLQDYKQAFKWFTKAAEQGEALAQFNVGVMY